MKTGDPYLMPEGFLEKSGERILGRVSTIRKFRRCGVVLIVSAVAAVALQFSSGRFRSVDCSYTAMADGDLCNIVEINENDVFLNIY